MAVRGWDLDIDWSRQGHYGGTLEDITSYAQNAEITATYGCDISGATPKIVSSTLDFALNNTSRQFSPENTSSPITGKVLPGAPTRLLKTHLNLTYNLFTGSLDSLTVEPNTPAKTFTGGALDAWGIPGAEVLSTPMYTGQRTGYLIGVVLDAIGWTGPREIDPGATYVAYWWEEGVDAATAIQKLVDSEGPPALCYVRGGTFVFHDRHHRLLTAASQTSQGTFTHIVPPAAGVAGDYKILRDTFLYDNGLTRIANAVVFDVEQRKTAAAASIWSTEDSYALDVNEAISIQVVPSDPFISALIPREGIEYQLRSGTAVLTLSRDSGGSTTLTITAGGAGATIEGMSVLANPVVVGRTVKVTEEDAGSIGKIGRRTWAGTVPWANAYDAKVIAQKIVSLNATGRPIATFTIANVNDRTATQQLQRQVSDRIRIRNDAMGLDAEYIIEQISHTVRKWLIHTTTFICQPVEPVQPANVFTFDVAGKGFDQGAFGINGVDSAASMFRFDVAGAGFDQGKFAS